MTYEILGGVFPVVRCELADGEQMATEKGSMVWMSPNMTMETQGSGFKMAFSRMATKESIFQNIFMATNGPGSIAFGASFPGKILPIEVRPDLHIVLQKRAFLASEMSVELSTHTNKKSAGFFSGQGFFMQKLSGTGIAFAEISGELVEHTLADGEQIIVSSGRVAGFEGSVTLTVKKVEGAKNKLLGGEGWHLTVLTGPGKVWIQTMSVSDFADTLRPYLPGNG